LKVGRKRRDKEACALSRKGDFVRWRRGGPSIGRREAQEGEISKSCQKN